jgi:hypothetical protein
MANAEHLALLQQGTEIWNDWRIRNPESFPDFNKADLTRAALKRANLRRAALSGANLGQADLTRAALKGANLKRAVLSGVNLFQTDLTRATLKGANLGWANLKRAVLSGANLSGANLEDANLRSANLSHANLSGASLNRAELIGTDISGADLTGSSIYGIAAWDVKLTTDTRQENLTITPPDQPVIMVDNIKVAQFIYLLLNNEEIRDVIDTITSKAVLILGRFSDDRKTILNALRDALRNKGFLPIVFDFERPKGRDFTETIMTLAGMSCFVIADITNPRSAPLELQATIPDYMIPFVPILQEGESAFSMFANFQTKYDWVFDSLAYDSSQNLIDVLDDAVITLLCENVRCAGNQGHRWPERRARWHLQGRTEYRLLPRGHCAGRHLEPGADRTGRCSAWRRGQAQRRTGAARAHRQPPAHSLQRPQFRVLLRRSVAVV